MRSVTTKQIVGCIIVACAGLVLLFRYVGPQREALEEGQITLPRAESAVGTQEDPQARARYEWRRLRDPKTGHIPENMRVRELAFAQKLPKRRFAGKKQVATWERRGPINVGGRSRALAIDLSNVNRILSGGVSGGIFLSEDGGTTWMQTFEPSQRPNVTALAQDPRAGHRNIWYAGTGEGIGNSASDPNAYYYGNGVYKSTDGGASWTLLPATTGERVTDFDSFFDIVWEVVVDPSNAVEDEVYVATYGALFRSMDGGQQFSRVLNSSTGGNSQEFSTATDVKITSGGVVYAALGGRGDRAGVWRSPTGASGSFSNITPEAFPEAGNYGRIVLAVNPSNEEEVWALAHTPGQGTSNHMLMRYDASEETWTDFSSYLPTRGQPVGNFNSQNGYDLEVAVHPARDSLVFVGGRNLWRLDVGGEPSEAATWIGGYTTENRFALYEPTGSDEHHPDQHALAFMPGQPQVMLSGSDGGVHLTANNLASGDGGVKWTSLNNGYFTTQFYTVCLNPDPSDPTIAGGMQDNGTFSTTTPDLDAPWKREAGGDGAYCAIVNNQDTTGTSRYVSFQNGSVFRVVYQNNQGAPTGFTQVNPPGTDYLFITPFELDPGDPRVMYLPVGDTLWRNANLEEIPLDDEARPTTQNWTMMTGAGISGALYSAVSATPGHRLYLGTSDGRVFRLDNAKSADPSTSPVAVTGASFPNDAYVSSIALDPSNSDHVMVTFSNYDVTSIFFSADGGASWTDVEGNLGGTDGPSVRWATILPNTTSGTQYFVGTSTGLYATSTLDGTSTTWEQEGASSIGNVVVDQVRAREVDGLVLAGTHGTGVYSAQMPLETGIEDAEKKQEATYRLTGGAPNPFGRETQFELAVRRSQAVSVVAYDARGRRVQTLYEGQLPAGLSRTLTLRGAGLASGTYFVRVTGERFAATRSVVRAR